MLNAFSYADYSEKPEDYRQNLWRVDHGEFKKPAERFISRLSVYTEAIAEQGQGPLEAAPTPKGMIRFASWMVKKFGIEPTEFSSVEDIAHRVTMFLDYTEPYYLFVNSCIQIVPNQLKYTYRFRSSGSVLPPEELEIFQVMKGWDFKEFKTAMAALEHPATDMIIRGEFVKHNNREGGVTVDDIFDKISRLVWGDPGFINSWVDEWLESFYHDIPINSLDDDVSMSMDSFFRRDKQYWRVVALGCLLWFRSEHALPFLCEYHPIYQTVLGWDKERNAPFLVQGSGGEAVVYGWDVYNHTHVIAEKNAPPGTCDCCHNSLHCSKLINAKAVSNPICSCGKAVDVLDMNFKGHGYGFGEACKDYRTNNAPVGAFACQRCLGMLLKKRGPDMACEQSMECPNTACDWHGGAGLYIRNLTDRRRMLLTHSRPQE